MKILWKFMERLDMVKKDKYSLFLLINSLGCSFVGLGVWLITRNFCLDSPWWAFCFVGYPGFFVGFIGGYIFLCRKNEN